MRGSGPRLAAVDPPRCPRLPPLGAEDPRELRPFRSSGPVSQAPLPAPPGRPISHEARTLVPPRRRGGGLRPFWTECGRETVLALGRTGRPGSPGDHLPPSSPRWVPLPLVAPAPRAGLPVLAFWGFHGSWGFPRGSAGKESACNAGDPGSIPGSGTSRGERHRLPTPVFLGFPSGSAGNESAWQCGRPGFDPWVGKIPWRRERYMGSVVTAPRL